MIVLLLVSAFVFAQKEKKISIDTTNATHLKLSEIADPVLAIPLEEPDMILDGIQVAEYIFVASLQSVYQYDLSGKLIRKIPCNGYVSDISSDTIKKELYVPVEKEIQCYDYSGKLKRRYRIKDICLNSLYYDNKLWLQSCRFENDSAYRTVSWIDLSTGKETVLPAGFNDDSNISSEATLTVYNKNVTVSFAYSDILYQIRGDNVLPIVSWDIKPVARTLYEKGITRWKGFIGDYLCINYNRNEPLDRIGSNNQYYLYMENMKNGKIHHVKYKYDYATLSEGIIDDLFHTGYCEIRKPLDKQGYFFFTKSDTFFIAKIKH